MARESSSRDPEPHWLSLSAGALAGPNFLSEILKERSPAARKKAAVAGVEQRISGFPPEASQVHLGMLLWLIITDLTPAGFSREEASEIVAAALRKKGWKWVRVERAIALYHASKFFGPPFVEANPAITREIVKLVQEGPNEKWALKPEVMAAYNELLVLRDAGESGHAAFIRKCKRLLTGK